MSDRGWSEAIALHSQAVSQLVEAVESLPADAWTVADSGKWAPAQIVEHLRLAYDVLLRELNGGAGMSLRMSGWQRFVLRYTLARRILQGGPFPKGARAPRETRPESYVVDRTEAITLFRDRATTFGSAMERARRESPGIRLTHAYFGKSGLEESLRFCARHVMHHARNLSGNLNS